VSLDQLSLAVRPPLCCLTDQATIIRARTQLPDTGPEFSSSTQLRAARQKSPTAKKNTNQAQPPVLIVNLARQTRHPTAKMADSDSPVTLRTRKFIRNPLLGRKQMVV
jgi:hypothetical protein